MCWKLSELFSSVWLTDSIATKIHCQDDRDFCCEIFFMKLQQAIKKIKPTPRNNKTNKEKYPAPKSPKPCVPPTTNQNKTTLNREHPQLPHLFGWKTIYLMKKLFFFLLIMKKVKTWFDSRNWRRWEVSSGVSWEQHTVILQLLPRTQEVKRVTLLCA